MEIMIDVLSSMQPYGVAMEMLLLFSGSSFVFLRVVFSLLFSSFSRGKSFLNNLMANGVGVDMTSSSLSSTFSRLIPVSRRATAQLNTQLRNRETPEEYRPASTNQSRGTLEQQRTTELGDEMRAVQSIYTACSRDQGQSSTVQDMYRLVTTLATEAMEAHLDSSIERLPRNTVLLYASYRAGPTILGFSGSTRTWATTQGNYVGY